ncbi:SMP-30/gluconolactonase/LRE family protein [Alsobacter sp. SYSU M60028]|uniref:SMP-30/gluconolactonase/LRE family protein n=1 Tax=Alsobacter ponti TaxID=2962936 RepID=A0ABT1LGC8_9HYPH|nr:IclR family transcriptional regulator C-terminal domain-containing protein [Alsobacter ponti]MCP8940559.1 SMP-30/gluconolactonase/LRE family protein [Alsobacter ponti]
MRKGGDTGEREDASAAAPGTGLVVKALNLIDLIAGAPGELRAQSLADHLGLPRSTVYRILNTLQQRGMVRLDPGSQGYFPGFKFLEYAEAVWPQPDLPPLAMTELRWLRELSGETTYFSVASGLDMVIVQKAEGHAPTRPSAPLGSRRPLHCTAMGKAHLAALPHGAREQLLARIPYPRLTERTVADATQLRSQLDVFRLRGYAIDDEELSPGFRCVSAAVPGEADEVLGTLSIAGPCFRLSTERAHQLGPELAAAARRLGEAVSRRAGRRPARPGAPVVPLLTDEHSFQGRAPAWDAASRSLVWADALAPAVLRANAAGPPKRLFGFAGPLRALAALGGEDGWFAVAEGADGAEALLLARDGEARPGAPALSRADARRVRAALRVPGGPLWLALEETPDEPAGLFTLDDAGLERRLTLDAAPSDMALGPGGHDLFVCREATGEIHRFVLDSPGGPLGPRRLLVRLDPIHGRPSALAVQDDGHVWVALRDGWGVARLDRTGTGMRLLPLPVPRPTGLAFGGPGGDVLYVTSERIGLTPQQLAEAPDSGGVFVLDRGLRDALLR